MKNIKFILLLLIFVLFGFTSTSTFATYSTSVISSNGYNTPIMDGSIQFKAILEDGKVYTKWTKYNKDEGFKYYKVIRSSTVSNPVYPDNGYIKYSSDVNFLSYVDEKVKEGVNYYRVCAITKESNRYCSNVVKIVKDSDSSISSISIPKNCVSWYDGCNTCSVTNGKLSICTQRACFTNNAPKCLKYKETEKPKVCTMEYVPVCGEKEIQCIKAPCNGIKKTYSNRCMLEGAGAKYLYKGECKKYIEPIVIGGNKDKHGCFITAGYSWCEVKNKCIRPWEEKCELNVIPYKLRVKADLLVRKLIVKVDRIRVNNEAKVKIINNIISKLENLKSRKEKLGDLIDYIVTKLKVKVDNLGGDFSDIEDIFNTIK